MRPTGSSCLWPVSRRERSRSCRLRCPDSLQARRGLCHAVLAGLRLLQQLGAEPAEDVCTFVAGVLGRPDPRREQGRYVERPCSKSMSSPVASLLPPRPAPAHPTSVCAPMRSSLPRAPEELSLIGRLPLERILQLLAFLSIRAASLLRSPTEVLMLEPQASWAAQLAACMHRAGPSRED